MSIQVRKLFNFLFKSFTDMFDVWHTFVEFGENQYE